MITGGAGFIGSNLAHKLIKNHDVMIIDDLSNGKLENIPKSALFLQKDILNLNKSEIEVFNPSIIFHFAAYLGVEQASSNPRRVIDVEYLGTKQVLESSRDFNIKSFIYASTSEVYGESPQHGSSEDDPVSPQTPYSVAKLLAEYEVKLFCKGKAWNWTICRFFNICGPRQDERFVIPRFIKQAISGQPITVVDDGSQIRSFMYIGDCVEILVRLMETQKTIGLINIGVNENLNILELANLIKTVYSLSSEIIYVEGFKLGRDKKYEIKYRKPNIAKLITLLDGYQFIPLENSLSMMKNASIHINRPI